MGSGADSPCQGEMSRSDRRGRVGDYEHKVLIGAVPGGVLPNPSLLPAKPSEAGSPGRGGARERTQFSPLGGNGVEWTQGELDRRAKRRWPGPLRRRAAMGKVGRRPQAAKFPAQNYSKNSSTTGLNACQFRRATKWSPGRMTSLLLGRAAAMRRVCFSRIMSLSPAITRVGMVSLPSS